jgi:hypothetical protein
VKPASGNATEKERKDVKVTLTSSVVRGPEKESLSCRREERCESYL